jgi:hypothetical protein
VSQWPFWISCPNSKNGLRNMKCSESKTGLARLGVWLAGTEIDFFRHHYGWDHLVLVFLCLA